MSWVVGVSTRLLIGELIGRIGSMQSHSNGYSSSIIMIIVVVVVKGRGGCDNWGKTINTVWIKIPGIEPKHIKQVQNDRKGSCA